MSKTNWKQFKRIVGGNLGNIPRIKVSVDVDQALETLEQVNQQSLASSTTTVTVAKSQKFNNITQVLKELILARKRARKITFRTRDPAERNRANVLGRPLSTLHQRYKKIHN